MINGEWNSAKMASPCGHQGKFLQEVLSSFLIKDLISICFSYCEPKNHLSAKWSLDEDLKLSIASLAFDKYLYILGTTEEGHSNMIFIFSSEGKIMRKIELGNELIYSGGLVVSEKQIYAFNPRNSSVYVLNGEDDLTQTGFLSNVSQAKVCRKWSIRGHSGNFGDLQLSPKNEIFIVYADRIVILNMEKKCSRIWIPEGRESFCWNGISVSPKGEIYLGDCFNNRIYVFDGAGKLLRTWDLKSRPQGNELGLSLALNYDELYIADYGNSCYYVYSLQGKLIRQYEPEKMSGQEMKKEESRFKNPTGIICNNGKIYLTNRKDIWVFEICF